MIVLVLKASLGPTYTLSASLFPVALKSHTCTYTDTYTLKHTNDAFFQAGPSKLHVATGVLA